MGGPYCWHVAQVQQQLVAANSCVAHLQLADTHKQHAATLQQQLSKSRVSCSSTVKSSCLIAVCCSCCSSLAPSPVATMAAGLRFSDWPGLCSVCAMHALSLSSTMAVMYHVWFDRRLSPLGYVMLVILPPYLQGLCLLFFVTKRSSIECCSRNFAVGAFRPVFRLLEVHIAEGAQCSSLYGACQLIISIQYVGCRDVNAVPN